MVYSKVKNIEELGRDDVYCLNVPSHGNFIVNDGMVVKNCLDAIRYALFTHKFGKDGRKLSGKDIDLMHAEAMGRIENMPRFFQDDHQDQPF